MNAQCMRRKYFETGAESIKSNYRKLFSHVSSLLDQDNIPIKMTAYSYELASRMDRTEIKQARRDNARVLNDIFSNCPGIRIINSGIENSDLYVPIAIDRRDTKQSVLSKKGIFNTVIWPLRAEQKSVCKIASYIDEHMLAVPCDQRYTKDDMTYIGTEIVRVINE